MNIPWYRGPAWRGGRTTVLPLCPSPSFPPPFLSYLCFSPTSAFPLFFSRSPSPPHPSLCFIHLLTSLWLREGLVRYVVYHGLHRIMVVTLCWTPFIFKGCFYPWSVESFPSFSFFIFIILFFHFIICRVMIITRSDRPKRVTLRKLLCMGIEIVTP